MKGGGSSREYRRVLVGAEVPPGDNLWKHLAVVSTQPAPEDSREALRQFRGMLRSSTLEPG